MPEPDAILEAKDARESETYIVETYFSRTESLSEFRDRSQRWDDFKRGEWTVEFPDGRKVIDRPKIENLPRTTVTDQSRLAAQFFPTIQVEATRANGTERAMLREQVLRYGHQRSASNQTLSALYADMISLSFAAIKVWPDFKTPIERRYPKFRRMDPRGVLPPVNWMVGDELPDLIYSRSMKLRDLRRCYPESASALYANAKAVDKDILLTDASDVEIVEFYDNQVVHWLAVLPTTTRSISTTLMRVPNRLGRPPVVLVPADPTMDLRSQIDDMLPVISAKNRLMTYMLDYSDQAVYAPILKRNMRGISIRFGPNAIIDVPEGGEVARIAPATVDPMVFRMTSDLEREARRTGNAPEARAGDISQSIGSAAFVESLMGGLTTHIRALQQQMELGLERANEIFQLADMEYCNARKIITGYKDGEPVKQFYTPKDLWDPEELGNIVTYGAGAGLDAFNREIRLQRRQQAGYVSRQWVMEQLEGLENPFKMKNQIMDETLLDALLAGVLMNAQAGNLEPAARLNEARRNKLDPLEVLPDIVAAAAPQTGLLGAGPAPGPGTAQPPSLPGEATAGQQVAAAQTGFPGGGTAPPPALADLLVR